MLWLFAAAFAQDNAASFDGDADYITLGALAPSGAFTFEAWTEWDSVGSYHTIVEAYDPTTYANALFVGVVAGEWQLEVNDTDYWEGNSCDTSQAACTSDSVPAAGDLAHVSVVYDGTNVTLYVDGTEILSDALGLPTFTGHTWVLGVDNDGGSLTSDSFDGLIDEVRIWDRALSASEVSCLYGWQLLGSEPDLYAYYAHDESAGDTTTSDGSGNGWDGTVAGDTTFTTSPFGVSIPTTEGDIDCIDYDGDGWTAAEGDCDETDASVNPDAEEVCDGIDNDCDGTTDDDATDRDTWYTDSDGDGWGDAEVEACEQPSDAVDVDGDCDDGDAAVNPDADEICDGIDNDCDGTIDPADSTDAATWYADADGDGFGDPGSSATSCTEPSGYGTDTSDCDDADAAVNPDAEEVCDGIDNDCDGTTDPDSSVDAGTWYVDDDGDGHGTTATETACDQPSGTATTSDDCDDTDASVSPSAAEVWYDGTDQDCDGNDDDQDGDGHVCDCVGGDDCDDEDADVYPGAADTWYDGVDADCVGDDDYDADGDGHVSESYGGDDCDDADAEVFPGADDEPYDGVVTDCDEADEYDADGDGHDSDEHGGDDCDDANSEIHPDAEETWYDGVDQDCDENDADQDEDGVGVDEDCDDTDPEVQECPEDTGDTGPVDTGDPVDTDPPGWDTDPPSDSDQDTGLDLDDTGPIGGDGAGLTGDSWLKGGGGCACSSGATPAIGWFALLAGLVPLRRRSRRSRR